MSASKLFPDYLIHCVVCADEKEQFLRVEGRYRKR